MDKAEASKILSVGLDANEKEINQAFRQLMIANHPDKGGSRYISEKGTILFQFWLIGTFLKDSPEVSPLESPNLPHLIHCGQSQ